MSNGVRYTPTFALPSEYEQQAMEARRRRRMAEMLAQQAYQPQEGGVAPIPTAAPLVQGLQAFLAARQERKAEEAAEKASQTESEYAKRLAGRLAGGYVPDFNVPAAEVPEQTELGEVTLTSQKRPAETLQQYQDRMRTAQFTSPTFDQMLARTPEQTALEPITPTARYKRSPEEALAMAETDVGMAAMKNRPMLAARLAKLLETPDAEEFYAPTETKTGLVQFGKRGGIRETKFEAAPKETAPTTLARLQAERAALPPGDPRIALYDKAIQSEVGSKTPTTNIINPKDTFKLEADLRGEFKDATKDFRTVRDAYQKIENALETGAGDIAVVYAFAKLNDPTSVVRESEFETVARAGSLPQRVQNFANLALEGKMNPQLRENLRQQARAMYLAKQQEADRSMSEFTRLAESYGLTPSRVLGGIDITPVGGKKEKSWTPELEKELRDLEKKLLNQGAIKP